VKAKTLISQSMPCRHRHTTDTERPAGLDCPGAWQQRYCAAAGYHGNQFADISAWRSGFDEVFARIAGRFAQACSRKRARAYLLGQLSRTERDYESMEETDYLLPSPANAARLTIAAGEVRSGRTLVTRRWKNSKPLPTKANRAEERRISR
jgi:hypothetical protein